MYQQGLPTPSPFPSCPPRRSRRRVAVLIGATLLVVALGVTVGVLLTFRAQPRATTAPITSTITRTPLPADQATAKVCGLWQNANARDRDLAKTALNGLPRADQRGGKSLYDLPGIWTRLATYADAIIPIWVGVREDIPLGTPSDVKSVVEGYAQSSIDIGMAYKAQKRDSAAESRGPVYQSAIEALCQESL